MGRLYIASAVDKAKSEHLLQAVNEGRLPKPPAGTQTRNICELCQSATILRYYVKSRGWCCESCWQLPTICTTRASNCHQTFAPYEPRNFDYLDEHKPAGVPQTAPAPRSDAKQQTTRKEPSTAERNCRRLSESKGHWDAMWQAQQRWHEARRAGEAKRNAFVRAAAQPVGAA